MNEPLFDEPTARREPVLGQTWGQGWCRIWGTWLPALLLIFSVRTYALEPYLIPTGSMAPTLEIGDRVVVDKVSYGWWVPATGIELPFFERLMVTRRFELIDWGDPQRGDIIVFRYPKDEGITYIKRVVALPGDHIRVEDNQVVLNGAPVESRLTDRYSYVDDDCRAFPTRRYQEELGGVAHGMITSAGRPGPLADWPRDGDLEEVVVPDDMVFVMGDNRDNSEDSRAWGFVRDDQIKGKARFVALSWDGCSNRARGERFLRSLYTDR